MSTASPTVVATTAAQRILPVEKKPSFRKVWKQHWMMYVMLIPAAVLLALSSFYPLWGISIAFVK